MNDIQKRLSEYSSERPSKRRRKATSRRENKEWLRYSQEIAMIMLDRMEELNLTQRSVADKMGCSQQYISKILKGTENLSIETICKIEEALDLRILEGAFVQR